MDKVRLALGEADTAALAALQRVLREPAALAAGGHGGIDDALERVRRARPSKVSVIVSSREPCIVDSRDSVMRRLGGADAAGRVVSVLRSPWFKAMALLLVWGGAIAIPLVYFGKMYPPLGLAFCMGPFAVMVFASSVMLSLPIIEMLALRFEVYFIAGHILIAAVGGFVMMEDRTTGWVWAISHMTLVPLALANDAVASRPRALSFYFMLLATLLAETLGLLLRAFPMVPAKFVVLQEEMPVRDRVQASLFVCALFIARFVATLYTSSGNFILLKGLRIAKCSKVAAEAIIEQLSVSSRVAAVTAAEMATSHAARSGTSPDAHTDVVASALVAGKARGAAPERAAPPPAHAAQALSKESHGALAAATHAARVATGGNDAAARQLLLGSLRELIGEREHRRTTEAVKLELLAQWSMREIAGHIETVHVVLPRFVPLMIDPNRTIAAALGGQRFNSTVYAVCRSRSFKACTAVITPFTYIIGVAALCDPGTTMLVWWVLLTSLVVVVASFIWQSLLLNTVVMRELVLQSWDLFFGLGNMYVVAATGAMVFVDPLKGAAWCVFQLSGTFFFFSDAAPASRAARRLASWLVGLYALFQVLGLVFFLQRVFVIQDFELHSFGVSVNIKYVCIGCQLNAALLTVRFAWRAVVDQSNLVFLDGLCRVTLLLSDATELRAHVIAGNQLAVRPKQSYKRLSSLLRSTKHKHMVAPS
jgi:hypothetical protein